MKGYDEYGLMPGGKVSQIPIQLAVGFDVGATSAWKSSPKTGKRLRLDWTKTAQDWKFPGPSKTTTVVWSSVSHDF